MTTMTQTQLSILHLADMHFSITPEHVVAFCGLPLRRARHLLVNLAASGHLTRLERGVYRITPVGKEAC